MYSRNCSSRVRSTASMVDVEPLVHEALRLRQRRRSAARRRSRRARARAAAWWAWSTRCRDRAPDPFSASYGSSFRFCSWCVYQSVPRYGTTATVTSRRMPSTACAYQSGKESLSPLVIRMPYGSTELSRSRAHSRVNVWLLRGASMELVTSGMSASASTGAASRRPRSVTVPVPPQLAAASHVQTPVRPRPAQSPHSEKLHR